MIHCENGVCRIEGPLTADTAGGILRALQAPLAQGPVRLDLGGVGEVDSAAVALVLSARRAAKHPFELVNAPASFATLAELYGVSDLLPL